MKEKLVEGFGWYGVVAILAAYVLISFNLVGSNSVLYQGLNLTGAIGIVIDALQAKNYQPAVLNVVWALVAIVAFIKILM